jgi:hypothetical protein
MNVTISPGVIALGYLAMSSPASAQWTPVREVPAEVYSVWANGDTIAAGSDSVGFVSTDDGVTWRQTAQVGSGLPQIRSVLVHDGRLYAGTYGQGIFVSDDLGVTWLDFNQGLVGGIANSQAYIADLLVDGDNLYAATFGAGVWIRSLDPPGTWVHFGDAFEPNQASTVAGLAVGGTRLMAAAGANGMVFYRDPEDLDWTVSFLNNTGFDAGVGPLNALWTGHSWMVSANTGVYRSATGASPWTFTTLGLSPLLAAPLALDGPIVFACFVGLGGSTLEYTADDGATWKALDVQPVITLDLAMSASALYAGRADGLWRWSMGITSVEEIPNAERLQFRITGPQPVRDEVVFRFELSKAGRAVIEVFDAAGRRVSQRLESGWSAGQHEVAWSARGLSPGVYWARLTVNHRRAVTRLVCVR